MEKVIIKESILRVNIDGNWSAREFNVLFNSLDNLYKIFVFINIQEKKTFRLGLGFLMSEFYGNILNIENRLYQKLEFTSVEINQETVKDFIAEEINFEKYRDLTGEDNEPYALEIREIKFSSPGWSDFCGFAEILSKLGDLIKYYFPNEHDKLVNRGLEQDIITKSINNLF